MAAPMKRVEALNRLTQSLNAVEGPTASALRLAGSSEKDYNDAMLRVVQSIDNRRGLIGKIPRANANIGIKPNANQSAKGKLILNYIESGFNRYLLSIDICIVLLRAKNVDLEDVKPALNFVDTLKNFYETLCSFVVDVPTNNAKVGSVKGALDSLLAVPIPARIMNTLNGVGGEAKNGNAGGFTEYTARVKVAVTAASAAIAAAKIEPNNATNAFGFGPPAAAAAAAAAANEAAAIAAAGQPPAGAAAAAAAALPRNNPLNVRANPPPPGTDASRRAAYDIATKALKEEAAARAAAGQVPDGLAPLPPALPLPSALPLPPALPPARGPLPRPPAPLLPAPTNVGVKADETRRLRNAYNVAVRELTANPTQEGQNKVDKAYAEWAIATGRTNVPPPPPMAGLSRAPAVAPLATRNYEHTNIEFKRATAPMTKDDYIAENVKLNPDKTVLSINGEESDPNTTVVSISFLDPIRQKPTKIIDPASMGRTQDGSLFFHNTFIDRKEAFLANITTTSRRIPAGGRRRTKSKSKASRKTKRRSTRRNRRS